MARADLVVELVRTGLSGNKPVFRKVVEAIISEERAKKHTVLAEKLAEFLTVVAEQTNNIKSVTYINDQIVNLFNEITPQKYLTDLVLSKDITSICQELITEHQRIDLLRSYNLEPRNRVLLIGPPGNGKTTLSECIANELMIPLFVIRYESLIGTYLGETAQRLNKLFEYVKTRRCVLFLDEFETLAKERGDTHETGEIKRVVSSLLLQIDSLPSHVIVIGATNHPELLDRAVWRRFQVRLTLPSPTRSNIIQLLIKYEQRMRLSFGYAHETLAKYLLGLSYAEIEEFCTNIFRQYVLNLPITNIKNIVSNNIKQLKINYSNQ